MFTIKGPEKVPDRLSSMSYKNLRLKCSIKLVIYKINR